MAAFKIPCLRIKTALTLPRAPLDKQGGPDAGPVLNVGLSDLCVPHLVQLLHLIIQVDKPFYDLLGTPLVPEIISQISAGPAAYV